MLKKREKKSKEEKEKKVYLQNQLDLFEEWKNEEIEKKSYGTSRRACSELR